MNLIKRIKWEVRKFLIDHYPKTIIDHEWPHQYGHKVNWDNPRNINEKIQWLICYSDTTEWTLLADKYKVREFIKEKGYEKLLVPLLGVWKNPEEIDFDSLPDKFVLKCNHDSASTKIVDKKSKEFDKDKLINFYKQKLKIKYGYIGCEPHYNKMKPLVIAEEFLEEDNGFSSLNDYKFWCNDGKVDYVSVMYDRTSESVCETVYDLSWNAHPEFLKSYGRYKSEDRILPRPQKLDEMVEIAKSLSKGFPIVRVDLYEVNGKIYFGEMTFTPTAGRMGYEEPFLIDLGNRVILPKKKTCPFKL